VLDWAGGYVIHVSSGTAGFTAAYWVGPRLKRDRERFPPNNTLLVLCGAGLLWLGWNGFNGGAPYAANNPASLAVWNTNITTATSLLVWTLLDYLYFGKPSVIGALQGMITGLVAITPAAGYINGWAAIIFGCVSGSVPWFTMMVLGKKLWILQQVDDTLGLLHTHCVSGILGGSMVGLFTLENFAVSFGAYPGSKGAFYGGGRQFGKQLCGWLFIVSYNVLMTSLILNFIRHVLRVPLRMSEEHLELGDSAAHGEEAYAMFGDGDDGKVANWYGYDSSYHAGNLYAPHMEKAAPTGEGQLNNAEV